MLHLYGLPHHISRLFLILTFSVLTLFMTACGGSGGSNSQPTQPTQPVSVIISNAPAGVNAGTLFQFAATVLNTTDASVTWNVTCEVNPSCDASMIGGIDAHCIYTAAASVARASAEARWLPALLAAGSFIANSLMETIG